VFFGFAFGMGGLGAAALGGLADRIGIEAVYRICSFLPAIGVLTAFLPNLDALLAERASPAVRPLR
jgi:FSR family fosmidomycin resistance protein-like MFS transporter